MRSPRKRPARGQEGGRASPGAEPRTSLYDEVTGKIIAQLEAGTQAERIAA